MKKIIALACLSALPFSYTAAEGFQVNAQSTKQAGMGHVGAAMKLGAESMHFNPAGLAFMDKTIDLAKSKDFDQGFCYVNLVEFDPKKLGQWDKNNIF